jgi:hypothetical protein
MADDDPITDLAELLAQTSALSSRGVRVFPWAPSQSLETAANRVVIFPVISDGRPPANVGDAIADEDVRMLAQLWAKTGGGGWNLKRWFIQALDEQAIGNRVQPAGYFWDRKTYQVVWPRDPDTGLQGQYLEMTFIVRFVAAAPPAEGEGRVDATSIDGTIT